MSLTKVDLRRTHKMKVIRRSDIARRHAGPSRHWLRIAIFLMLAAGVIADLTLPSSGVSSAEGWLSSEKAAGSSTQAPRNSTARVDQLYGKLPLSFAANEGQLDKGVQFLARGNG